MEPEGDDFKPSEPYTHRLRRILDEYPDGSQVLREILQNSDDAKSTEQIFILDHNTYSSNGLFNPKFHRFQGPALLAINDKIFKERDFTSLLKLADSEKRDQFDKIGAMGVGFNSIYHITDSPSFITDDKYVILDPHEWYYNGGKIFKFVVDKLAEKYPGQFAPFRKSWNESFEKPFEGTIFRYPLRDSDESDISDKIYEPQDILDMFHKFYENESINCLLFLKYIERIRFYELKKGANKLELLYTIQLENADEVRCQRRLISDNIVPMMNSLKSKKLSKNDQLDTSSYVASFSRQQGGVPKETNSWLILNYLDSLLKAEAYFQKEFKKSIGDYKFIPNVGLALPLGDLDVTGKLFCFLPLPVNMPFHVSVHGYFAVSTNRRTLWSAADNEELAVDALARLKVKWNLYLFEEVLPKAWVKLLCELPFNIPNVQQNNVHKFWPIINKDKDSALMSIFCKNLLQNVVSNLGIEDSVFKGPSMSNTIGVVNGVPTRSYSTSSFQESEFYWLSIYNGYLEDEKWPINNLYEIIESIGFPIILNLHPVIEALKNSSHRNSLKLLSPEIIRTYLNSNRDKWEHGAIERNEALQLFNYILQDKQFNSLKGFKMIPLANGKLGTLTRSGSNVYLDPDPHDYDTNHSYNDERHIFEDQLQKFIDKSIDSELYKRLYENAKTGWNLNIKILDELAVADMIKYTLNHERNKNLEEIPISNNREWIYQLWDNLIYRNWDLRNFEDIHLIPTSCSTLRKLKTPRKVFLNKIDFSLRGCIPILEKFGAVFVDNRFNVESHKINPYIIKPDDIMSVLSSFQAHPSYPRNLNCKLQYNEISMFIKYLSICLQQHQNRLKPVHIEVIKHFPIFTEIGRSSPISLKSKDMKLYLLPREDENSYGKIIYPSHMGGFLDVSSQDSCIILENIIRIPRLTTDDYWRKFVVPFLERQSSSDIDIVVDKFFNRLPLILDEKLKNDLGKKSFVPAGTLEMSKRQKLPTNAVLVRPIDLFDPEKKEVNELFFEDEKVFPAGKYGMSSTNFFNVNKFLSNLRSLGIKSTLTTDDIVFRINTIMERKRTSHIHDFIHINAKKLFRYIDKNWDQLINKDGTFSDAILENEWIPTTTDNESGKKIFSKPRDCYCQEYKYLVCFVAPILEYNIKSKNFLEFLNWNTNPDINTVLKQLEYCRYYVARKQPPMDLESICNKIYAYMNITFQHDSVKFNKMKNYLKHKSWILCGETFRSNDEVVINIPENFVMNNDSLVRLPKEYNQFKNLFKAMGVRDEIGIKDLIIIIKNIAERNENEDLSIEEIRNVVQILDQIVTLQMRDIKENDSKSLNGLLIPSTKNVLVDLQNIYFDDVDDRLDDDEKSKYMIAHPLVSRYTAKKLNMQTLIGKICDTGDNGWEPYEQNEPLTTRIKNIIKEYSPRQIIKEFLQNADDAKATRFSVIVDRRKHTNYEKSLLTEEMKELQGPAIWIYNDAEFSEKDFQALINLGIGGKSRDDDENDTRIGKFGLGFNCAFHITDLPSFVSGETIAFIDPHAKFLPAKGYPPKRLKGIRMNFIEKEFKKLFPDQCYPYEAIEGCDFTKKFKGTLFRLPLRTHRSKISTEILEINEILRLFNGVEGNKEMLFLRNIESCSLYDMKEQSPNLIWEAKINNIDSCRNFRQKVIDSIDDAQVYQLDIEKTEYTRKDSEIWAICTGGHDKIKPEFKELKEFSQKERIKPRGGVATLLARSDEKSLDELKAESFPNPPKLRGEIFSYLSLSMVSRLGVHLNGNFSLSNSRLQSENDFLKSDCDYAKWNRYVLLEVLSDLHVKLLEYIVELEEARHIKDSTNFTPHTTKNFWPINDYSFMDLYTTYGLSVIRKLGVNGRKFFWTEANDGRFISLNEARILEEEKANIANILVNLEVPIRVVKLDKGKMKQLDEIAKIDKQSKRLINFPYTPISGKLICKELQLMRPFKHNNIIRNDNTQNSLFQLLTFILEDKDSFDNLARLPLIPLSDGSVGEFGGQKAYYIGKQKHLNLFPNGRSRLITIDLPKDLLDIFSSNEFSEVTNIQKFNGSAILDLLKGELPSEDISPWNSNGKHINKNWLQKIWSMIFKSEENINFAELSEIPLLPVINPISMLIKPDMTNPLLCAPKNGQHSLYSVLVKLNIRFTDMSFPDDVHEDLKKYVVQCAPINILSSLGNALTYTNMDDLEQLFDESNLSISDYAKFRTFINEEIDTLIEQVQNQRDLIIILVSLPIWSIHSCEDNFINARSGILLPYDLPFFSFRKNTTFYKCNNKSDFNTLVKLGAKFISELDYVKDHILPSFKAFSTPPRDYIPFLQAILLLNNPEIEQYFRQREVIPNKSLTEFVSADTLYDMNNPLFRSIFADTDKILPQEFQSNHDCLNALGRIGLKRQMNCNIFVECAQEIDLQIKQGVNPHVVKERAKNLVRYLYENINTLSFNNEQWNKIKKIKFVPSEKNLRNQFYKEQKETSSFESFENLCSRKYVKICWTQCPLFDENVEPNSSFNESHQEIGFPSAENIIEHWFVIVKMSKANSWNRNYKKELKGVINEIYQVMNTLSEDKAFELLIKLKIDKPEKKIFLNGDDPFDEKNWVAGKELLYGIQEDIKGMYKVKDCLKEYKSLLILAGASEIAPPRPPSPNPIFNQKDKLVNSLQNKLIEQDNKYHDVIFNIGGEKIGANKYVLSAASKYFDRMFYGGLSESAMDKKDIIIEDIRPDIFRALLQWLYGKSFDDAIEPVLSKPNDIPTGQSYETYYLTFLVDLLKVTNYYGVELKEEVEDKIINSPQINVTNVCNVLERAKESDATRLIDFCKQYIESNRKIIIKQLSELNEDADERSKISQMLDTLLSDN
ncbi:sacsin isoform X2 [Rhizophagus clarus]|uniref:Sacsin isoform X2 n=1 Tax=Rhizophagus clarus TaxID=94130 RepID=A0A8H3R0F4_9GLOM|nr:sacsin isoform X2 [Rhizophagus clarus]